jgi:adenylate cyclase class IV
VTIALLEHALGSCGVVRRSAISFLLRHTRIHLDEVEGLGTFVELETVLSDLPEEEAGGNSPRSPWDLV